MLRVLDTAESKRLDTEAADRIDDLMGRAGWALAGAAIAEGAGYGSRVAVLAGPGNNGGDGWEAARRLAGRGCHVTVHQLTEPKSAAARRARDRTVASVDVAPLGEPDSPDLVIDALFGSGIRDDLPEAVRPWLGAGAPVIAAHVPSGLDPDTGSTVGSVFHATTTVAFHALSPGHVLGRGPDVCGRVVVADIGLDGGDPVMVVAEESDALLPARSRTAHKWSTGAVMVVGGSQGKLGAAVMTARAALRFGAGAVGIAVPSSLTSLATQLAPEVLGFDQGEIPGRFDVVIAGPGMGSETAAMPEVMAHDGPVVLDAEAIGSVSSEQLSSRSAPTLLTPHAGEFTRFFDSEANRDGATRVAQETGASILLKGAPTLVCDGGVPVAITSNGPELATIGTGDVLAGMVGALVARGLDVNTAAVSGAYWHGCAAADLARTRAVTAPDLVSHVATFAGVTR